MNKQLLSQVCFLFFFICGLSVSAQDIKVVGAENVNRLKLEGKLTGKEQYTNSDAKPNVMRVAPQITPTPASTSCDCWIPRDGSFQIGQFDGSGGSGGPGIPPDYRNDDWSTISIGIPFNFCFYGQQMTSFYLNNNGNISFGGAYSTFTANSFPDPSYIMVAPFWADVDTRGPLSGLVYYKITPTYVIIQWENVGYFASQDDKLNSFQLIISDGLDPILGVNRNVSFCYKDMSWTTGSASSGTNGFGGIPATVGVNQGNGTDYIQFGLFDQPGTNFDGPYGFNDGVDWLDNQSFTFNVCVGGTNIPPVLNSLNICDTIRLCENTTYQLTANYLSPEQGEITSINYFLGGMAGISVLSNTPGNTASLVLEIVGQTANLGYHTISVTAIDNAPIPGSTTSNFVIEVLPAPLPSFTFAPASPVLINTPVTFTNTTPPGSLLTWDFGDGSPTTTVPSPQHTFTAIGTYNVSLTAMFPNGCTSVVTQQITITQCSPATFSVTNVCTNAPSQITYTGVASAIAIYTWDFNGGTVLSGSGAGPYDVSWNTPGNYTLSLTVTEPTCSSSVSLAVDVYAIPVSSITSLPALCAGDSPTVSFNGVAGPAASYTWNFSAAAVISGSGQGPYDIQWGTAGNDQIELIVTENGCSDTSLLAVLINPIPTADFIVPAAACTGEDINVNYTGTASPSANYVWDFNGANIVSGSGQGGYTINWSTGANYSVSLIVTENGCTSPPINMPVAITQIPVVSISPVPALCEGSNEVVSFTGTAGATANYQWNFGSGTVVSGSGAGPYSVQYNTPGQEQIQLTVNENGCIASSDIYLTVYPIPTSDFVINNSACINDPITINYSGTATPAAIYNWVFGGGNVVSGNGAGPYTLVWNTSGNYQLSLTVSENGCVSGQTDLMANVNPLPAVFAGNNQIVCSGIAVPLGNPAVPGETYQWFPPADLSNTTISNPVATPINNTTSTQVIDYTLTVTDANGCVNTDNVEVSAFPVPIVNYNRLPGQCLENNSFNFSANSNIPSGVNFSWTFTPQASQLASAQKDVTVTYSSTGTFPVLLSADYNGCPAQLYADSVSIYEMPTSDFLPQIRSGCVPLVVPFANSSTGIGNSYNWTFGDGKTDNVTTPEHIFTQPGIYSVALTARNIHGCLADTTYKDLIEVYALPNGQFAANPEIANILAPVVQFQNYSSNVATYLWDLGDSSTSTEWSPNHLYEDTGNYSITLMLVSPNGCVDTVRGIIRVEDNFSFYIPNAFSPNGDGVNDSFRGYGVAIKKYLLNIYNRWGELIYTTDNYDKPWDGQVNSNFVQSDVYVYRIALTDHHGASHTYLGNVTVIR